MGSIQEHQFLSLGLAAILSITVATLYKVYSNPLSKVPGPWHTKLGDVACKFYGVQGQQPAYIQRLHEKYGPIVRISPTAVDICDPASVQKIYGVRGEFMKSKFYDLLVPDAYMIFNTRDPEYHRRHRRILMPELSETGLKKFIPQINAKVQLAMKRISEEMETRGVTDILKWSLFLATDVIGELSFGDSFRMLELGKKNKYIMDLEAIAPHQGMLVSFPFLFQVAKFVPIPGYKFMRETMQGTLDSAGESLERHRKLLEEKPTETFPTLLSNIYKAEKNESMTAKEILDTARAYIIAGSDTITNTMTYLIWSVCRNPRVKAKLVDEVKRLPANFEVDVLKKLPYLNQVIDEALRLHAATPGGLPREVPPDGATLGGYWFPGGVTVQMQAYSLHRNSDVFPEPEKFIPERWEKPTQEMKDSYMPWGGGSRSCVGTHLARLEIRLFITNFFRTFPNATVSTAEGMCVEDMDAIMFFLMAPKGGRCLINAV